MDKKKKLTLPFFLAAAVVVALAATLAVILLPRAKENPKPEEEYNRVHVFHDEVRGVFIPTVYNLAFPSAPDLSADELQSEIDAIVGKCAEVGLNGIYFQVRPSCDALYRSEIFPVSKYLFTDGTLPFDPLEYLVGAAHAKNISVSAWVNPLRISVEAATPGDLPDGSPAKGEYSEYVVSYGGKLYFDPAEPKVRALVSRGVSEIVENYEVDSIIFDDYFYPYKVYEQDETGRNVLAVFDDEDSYKAYATDDSGIEDFRRENVNRLIASVHEAVKEADPKCRFGVAPFGIWQNDNGENGGSLTSGLESYSELYCDTLSWIENKTVDFIAPQIYWDTSSLTASFKVLAAWWNEKVKDSGVDLYFSHAAYRYADGDFEAGEMTKQLDFAKSLENYKGSIFYSFAAFRDDLGKICGELSEYYK